MLNSQTLLATGKDFCTHIYIQNVRASVSST